MSCYTVQGRNERGRWADSKVSLKIYAALGEAIKMAKDLDEHGNSVRVVLYSTPSDAYRGEGATVVWTPR